MHHLIRINDAKKDQSDHPHEPQVKIGILFKLKEVGNVLDRR